MTIFDSFNKPSWQHRDPETRKSAITDIEDEATLLSLVQDDPDDGVRSLALARISNSSVLEDLTQTLPPDLQNQAKAQLLALLLPDASQLSSLTDDALLVRIAGLAEDPQLIDASISQVKSPETRMELAVNHPLAKVRITAAKGIESAEQLRELMLQTRHKDKSVYRYCKEHLDTLNAAVRVESERRQKIGQLSEDARSLSTAVDSPEYKARFQVLEHRWAPLKEHAAPGEQQQIEGDLEICSGRMDQLGEVIQAEEDRQAQIAGATQSLLDILEKLDGIDLAELQLTDGGKIQAFTRSLDEIEDRWLAAMHYAQPASKQTKECKDQLSLWRSIAEVSKRLVSRKSALVHLHEEFGKLDKTDYMAHHKLLQKAEKHLKKLPWPESQSSTTPAPILQLQELQANLQQHLSELKKQEKNKLQQLDTAFEALRKELDDSHFNNADRFHNKIRNLLKHLGPDHQDHFHHELRPLTARLHEIHDWQGFAIEPKKIDLCERMAALIGSDEVPDALAAKIKAMQTEWKTLGHISPRRDQALWKKFHAAAEQAYKPCKQAFAQQSVVRKENLKQRMALVEQLIDYDNRMHWPGSTDSGADTADPDWRMVQKTLDTARTAFNNIKPVDGKGERKSRKALQAICDLIYSHVKDEYERNISRKETLVSEAKSLLELEDLRDAINRAKDLQRDWKNVGITPRQLDRKFWKEFRAACDGVFGRLDEQRKVENSAKNERAEQARLRAQQKRERWPRLLDRMQACALKSEDAEKATGLWEREDSIPSGIDKEALAAWWENGCDLDASEDALREACIAMEILIEVESPPEDKEARMAYQMQRLLEGMGSAQGEHDDRLLDQVNAFIAMRPPEPWLERFCCDGKIIPQKSRTPG
jgi:exonuclease SbcC